MGLDIVESVIEGLQQVGIRAERGFPAKKMPYLTGPVAAVYLKQMKRESVTVAIRIYSPMKLGGAPCEEAATQATQIMKTLGAKYQVSECKFGGTLGLFSLDITALIYRATAQE